jgi:hypothetical protein
LESDKSSVVTFTPNGYITDKRIDAALESFDERDNRDLIANSVTFNLNAACQDKFGETFYRTYVVSPDQVGFSLAVQVINVFKDKKRDLSGKPVDYGYQNLLQAAITPSKILDFESTKIVPVVRPENVTNFVAAALVAPKAVMYGGESVNTAPYAVGVDVDYIGTSATDTLLNSGKLGYDDVLDTSFGLEAIYVKVTDGTDNEVVRFDVSRMPGVSYLGAQQGQDREMVLNVVLDSLVVDNQVKQADGTASTLLAPIATGNYRVRLKTLVSGRVHLQNTHGQVFSTGIEVTHVHDTTGANLSLTAGAGQTIKNLFTNAAMVGYDVAAHRANLNRRERGLLVDGQWFTQAYTLPLLAPITTPRPLANTVEANEASDLSTLITTTRFAANAAAVKELLNVGKFLKSLVATAGNITRSELPASTGIGRHYLTPVYLENSINVANIVSSLTSSQHLVNIRATLTNMLSEMVYTAYRKSGWQIAADAFANGQAPKPRVLIGTDPYIAQFLMTVGDTRLLGESFQDFVIVESYNEDMAGKIVFSFTNPVQGQEGVHPMEHGVMAYRPELVSVLPMPRDGKINKELTVMPSFLHITLIPIQGQIEVTGLTQAMVEKIAVDFNQV